MCMCTYISVFFRNHLNDIENIIPFVLIGFFYVHTNPSTAAALWHFRLFTASRFLHTLMYQVRYGTSVGAVFIAAENMTCLLSS